MVRTWFAFASGLAKPVTVPVGTTAALATHVASVEARLGLCVTQYLDNPKHWDHWAMKFENVSDEVLCETVEEHNRWVRRTYRQLVDWYEKPLASGEVLTPEACAEFWHGFEELVVPPERWTMEYYRARMESAYDVLRGCESEEGRTLGAPKLTPKQASAVIRVFEEYLDRHDLRLEVPWGHDYLASSYDGGYDWCGTCCRAMHPDDVGGCRRKKCELREEDA
jgi:hypothetical protein